MSVAAWYSPGEAIGEFDSQSHYGFSDDKGVYLRVSTREWLASDPDAYLFLIIDELHLVRGSADTEVSFLIKSLLQRLRLDKPELIHKLRILASSASLPLDAENEAQSLRYLRDLFAPYGTSQGPG
jgi:hypothetical protein